jgi:hypothetical protein
MPRQRRPRQFPDLGSRFRRLASVAEGRRARGTKAFPEGARRARLRFPYVPPFDPPRRPSPRAPAPCLRPGSGARTRSSISIG